MRDTNYPPVYSVIYPGPRGRLEVWSVCLNEPDGWRRLLDFCRGKKDFVVVEGASFQRYHYPGDYMFREQL